MTCFLLATLLDRYYSSSREHHLISVLSPYLMGVVAGTVNTA